MRKLFTRELLLSSFAIISLLFFSCRNDLEELTPGAGTLTFDNFVSIGDEYVAGYANWGLYEFSQENSFPNLLSQQFRLVKNINFKQPTLRQSGTGFQELEALSASACPEKSGIPEFRLVAPSGDWQNNISSQGPFNNMGIPGLQLNQLADPNLGVENPFYQRISSASSANYLEETQRIEADLCVIWLGSQEILKFVSQDGLVIGDNLSAEEFRTTYQGMMDSLLNSNTSSVLVANIPPLLSFPYFSAVSSTFFPEDDCESRGLPIYISTTDENGNESVRIATINDHILLPSLNEIGKENGGLRMGLDFQSPLPDKWVMDMRETALLQAQLDAYNAGISNMVDELNADFQRQRVYQVDLASAFSRLANGTTDDGIDINYQYINGGVFSLDGLYLTPRGNAFVANVFIELINEAFSASIPLISLADYPAVFFP